MNAGTHTLVTFRFSHYNEKARWALDRFGVPYREFGCLPLFHVPVVLWFTRGLVRGRRDRVSSPFSTPVLLRDDGPSLHDSSAIVRYVSQRYGTPATDLYPVEEVTVLEKHFHDTLGADTRLLAYHHLLAIPGALARLADANVGRVQSALFRPLAPWVARSIQRGFRIDAARVAQARSRIHHEFLAVGERLADGRRYLLGDHFTAADLAFACMAAPVLLPQPHEGFGGTLPTPHEAGPAYESLVAELRDTPAGRFALRMFAMERGRRVIGC